MNIFKSKTIGFNIVIPAVSVLLNTLGVVIPESVTVGVLAIGNFILRFFTSVPLDEK